MSPEALSQYLIDVTRGHLKSSSAAEREAALTESDLDDATRAAIRKQDIASLWRAGAHPMALLYFARACGWPGEKYYACIAEAGGRQSPSATGN